MRDFYHDGRDGQIRLVPFSEHDGGGRGRRNGGRSLEIDGRTHSIIGVAEGALDIPSQPTRWWAPVTPEFAEGRSDVTAFEAVVRLAGSWTAAEAVQVA